MVFCHIVFELFAKMTFSALQRKLRRKIKHRYSSQKKKKNGTCIYFIKPPRNRRDFTAGTYKWLKSIKSVDQSQRSVGQVCETLKEEI